MDRRYYLSKAFLIVAAVALALTSGTIGNGMTRTLGQHTAYSAAAQMQDAAWHATSDAAKVMACLISRTLKNLP